MGEVVKTLTPIAALRALLNRHEKMLAVENPEDCPCSMTSSQHAEAIRELDAAREVLARGEGEVVAYVCAGQPGCRGFERFHVHGGEPCDHGPACRPLRYADE